MDHGYFHPDSGYWQTIGAPPADILSGYPEGTIEVPLKPGANFDFIDGEWIAVAPAFTSTDVDAERDKRTDGGFTFGGVRYQSRPSDRENIAGASTAALGAMMLGAQSGDLHWHGGASDFVWIAEDNSETPMDAQTMFAFGQAAMAHKQAQIFAARSLKDAISAGQMPDIDDDANWPA